MAEPMDDRYSWDAEVHCWYCERCGCLVRDREPHNRFHFAIDGATVGDGR